MPDLGKAYVQIVPSAQGIQGNIERLLGGPAESAGKTAGGRSGNALVGAIKKAAVAAGIGKVLKDAFDAGGALEQSFGGLDTIYGDAADAAKKYAAQAASAGISANTYAEQAVSFGAALKQAYGGDTTAAMEAANTAIMDMADNSAKMGTDIGSLQTAYQGFAKQNYTMLDNLKLGYGGTKTEMERLLADAQKISGVEYDIENLGDVYDAIHVIQEDLGLTGVAADEAKTTLSGSFGAMKASWENLMAAMTTGEGLDAALGLLTISAGNFVSNVMTMAGNLVQQIPQFLPQLLEGLIQGIPGLLGFVGELFGQLIVAFGEIDWASLGKQLIDGIISGVVAAASRLWDAVRSVVRNALTAGQQEAEVGSPSRLFARELGQWLPAGAAVGVEENTEPFVQSVRNMVDLAAVDFARSTAPRAAVPVAQQQSIDYERLAAAISRRPVVIEGDTSKIFRVVRQTNTVRTRATNYNALGAMT